MPKWTDFVLCERTEMCAGIGVGSWSDILNLTLKRDDKLYVPALTYGPETSALLVWLYIWIDDMLQEAWWSFVEARVLIRTYPRKS